ncbi:MAG TPA: hypothetical protein VN922_02810 [Bacteroidia bacterium]|nr:hypothetical protein [Bacteroidia bacterium]
MKHSILLLLALPSVMLHAQNADSLAAKKTDNRSFIPGTHISMVLPQGFKYAKDFMGIEKDDKTFIKIYDPYESDYNTSSAAFTRPMFESKGYDVFTFKMLNVGKYTAKYSGMKSSTGYKNYELVFGDTTFSAMLYGHCSVNDEATSKSIEDALLSIKYDKTAKADPYVHGYFSMNDSSSVFKFSKFSGEVFDYTVNGNMKSDKDDAAVTITPFTIDKPMTDKDIKKSLESIYKQDGMTGIKVKNESDAKINGYDAYESEVYGKMNGKQTLIYQLTIAKGGNALLFMGITRSDFDNNLKEFKKLAYTINFKDQATK